MATAKKATKKTAAKKTASTSATKKTAAKTETPKQDAVKAGEQKRQTSISKQEARDAKAAAMSNAPETKKTVNPKGSWPFPTGERP